MRRKETKNDILWDTQIVCDVKSSSINDEQNHFCLQGINAQDKFPQCDAHDGGIHGRKQEPEILSRYRTDERVGVQPLVVRIARCCGARSPDCPDSAHGWLKTETRLILKPQLNVFVGMENCEYGERNFEYFFSKRSAQPLSHFHYVSVSEPAT